MNLKIINKNNKLHYLLNLNTTEFNKYELSKLQLFVDGILGLLISCNYGRM